MYINKHVNNVYLIVGSSSHYAVNISNYIRKMMGQLVNDEEENVGNELEPSCFDA